MVFPILTYHEIFNDSKTNKEKHAIHVNEFDRHMRYLVDNGFRSLNLSDIFSPDNGKDGSNTKPIAISFDDGNYSDYCHVFPILRKYNLVGNFFITTDWVAQNGFLSWDNLKEMKDSGMSIQSHSVSHRFLPNLSNSDLRKELRNSKRTLEERLNVHADLISIPSGFVSKRVIEIGKNEGYKGMCTSVPGMNNLRNEKQYFLVLHRFTITRRTSFDTFKRIVDGDASLTRSLRARYQIKSAFRKAIGNRAYYKLWCLLSKEI